MDDRPGGGYKMGYKYGWMEALKLERSQVRLSSLLQAPSTESPMDTAQDKNES